MQLVFSGPTTMTSNLETDMRIAAGAGYNLLEIMAAKLDNFL